MKFTHRFPVPEELKFALVDYGCSASSPSMKIEETEEFVKVLPVPVTKGMLIFLGVLFGIVGIGIIVYSFWDDELFRFAAGDGKIVIILFGVVFLLMGAIVPPSVYYIDRSSCREGPWLVLERKTGLLELSRTGKTFDISKEVINFQECYGEYSLHHHRKSCSELNLLVKREGDKLERYPILLMGNFGVSQRFIRRISQAMEMPLVRCTWWDRSQWVKWSKEHRRE